MTRINRFIAVIFLLVNLIFVAALTLSSEAVDFISGHLPLFATFGLLIISFSGICYLAWYFYTLSAQEFDPAGVCIIGFILPMLTAFIATLNWSSFSLLAHQTGHIKYAGLFNYWSLAMMFVLFSIGALTWGFLMNYQEYENKTQSTIAVGYTVLSYWFGFVIFCWAWLLLVT